MDRRGFLKLFGAAVAGVALEQAIPLGRVWSFPKEIILPGAGGNSFLTVEYVSVQTLRMLERNLRMPEFLFNYSETYWREFPIGTTVNIRLPQTFEVGDRFSIQPARLVGRPSSS